MEGSHKIVYLCFSILLDILSVQGDDTGLVVSTAFNWLFGGQLHVFPKDPSTYDSETTVEYTKMDIGNYSRLVSIAANTRDNSLVFLDGFDKTIYYYENFNIHMNATNRKLRKIHTGVSEALSQVAVDWLTGNVYWTDGSYNWIAWHPLKFDVSYYQILVSDNLTKPAGIAVDPLKRYLFWSDVIKDRSQIERASLTGEHRAIIVKSDIPLHISSIALDIDKEVLYWADTGRRTIEYCNYDGSERGVLVKTDYSVFLTIAVSQDVVCGVEYKEYIDDMVMCYDKISRNMTWFNSYTYHEPRGITVYDSDLQPMQSHPCESKNCAHMCINNGLNTATCTCKEGYKLKSDGVSCQSEHGLLFGKAIIAANETSACMYDIHVGANPTSKPDCVLTNLNGLQYFAVDSHERMFYYYDYLTFSIKKVDILTTQEKTLYTDTTLSLSGFAYDWTTKNIFWSDSAKGKIVLYSTITSSTTNLVTGQNNPSDITINPHARKMYWITTSSNGMSFEEANMDGSDVKTMNFFVDRQSLKALFYDATSDRLYCFELGSLISFKTDGSTGTQYHYYIGEDSNRLLIYKDYAFWSTSGTSVGMRNLVTDFFESSLNVSFMNDVTALGVYDQDMQPMKKNNCTNYNGGCQHICQPTGTTSRVCLCDYGYAIQTDGTTCSNTPFEDFFAILPDATHHKLYQVSLSNGEVRALDIPDVHRPMSAIYDKPVNKIYWTNEVYSEIRASTLKSTRSEQIFDIFFTEPIGLAIDYSSGLLYFTTNGFWFFRGFIACIHTHVGNGLAKKLITDLESPQNIALYPSKGLMFWTHITDDASYIGSSFMDGKNVNKIVQDDIKSPDGIVIDYEVDRIYWADPELGTIQSVTLEGGDRRVVIKEANTGLVGLDISPPYLYYVGRNKQRISKYDLRSNNIVSFMNDIHALGRTESVRVYPEQVQPKHSNCSVNNGGCEVFCLPTPTGRTCGCDDSDVLNDDGATCRFHISCDVNIPNALLEHRCLGHTTGTCNYTCANGYEKTVDLLECDEHGKWNHPTHTVCQSIFGTCKAVIPHGHVSVDCDKKIGSTCTYVCNVGYFENTNDLHITCQANSAWSKPLGRLCRAVNVMCPKTINNGKIVDSCPRTSGVPCDVSCNQGFEKNAAVLKPVCLGNGQWNLNDNVCISAARCTSNIPNGAFIQCDNRIHKSCSYSCKNGYVKRTIVDSLACLESGMWNFAVDKLCSKALKSCTKSIKHGKFSPECSATHGARCNFKCKAGYVPQPIANHVICHNGNWTIDTDYLCIDRRSLSPLRNFQKQGSSPGSVVGIVIAAIAVTAIVVLAVIYVLSRRQKKEQGQYIVDRTNLRFRRFDDSNTPSGIEKTEGSHIPSTNGSSQQERYVTADVKTQQ